MTWIEARHGWVAAQDEVVEALSVFIAIATESRAGIRRSAVSSVTHTRTTAAKADREQRRQLGENAAGTQRDAATKRLDEHQ
jgi:hypothetical protein